MSTVRGQLGRFLRIHFFTKALPPKKFFAMHDHMINVHPSRRRYATSQILARPVSPRLRAPRVCKPEAPRLLTPRLPTLQV